MADEGEETPPTAASTTRARKNPRPEIQLYRPGMLRKGDSTKSLASDERPPRSERTDLKAGAAAMTNRRRSNDTDSVNSRGGSGSTTPDANVMNERYGRYGGNGGSSSYNSTQSLYETQKPGKFRENNVGRREHQQQHKHGARGYNNTRQPFERNFNRQGNSGSFHNERASMRGDGVVTKRVGGGRKRNDSMNSTQSEMPQSKNQQIHVDTSSDSVSQCGPSSAFSSTSLGEAMSFEEMCKSFQSMASLDWSKEVENEYIQMKEQEEAEERQRAQELQNSLKEVERTQKEDEERNQLQDASNGWNRKTKSPRRRYRRDESDRESSFGGSIAEEEEDEELKSGEKTPTSERRSYGGHNPNNSSRNYRNNENGYRQNRRGGGNGEIRSGISERRQNGERKERRYRGEHDDRDDERSQYEKDLGPLSSHMTSGRLAGRLSIVRRDAGPTTARTTTKTTTRNIGNHQGEKARKDEVYQKMSSEENEEAAAAMNREQRMAQWKAEIDRNQGKRIREFGDEIAKLLPQVAKNRKLEAATQVLELSSKVAQLHSEIILHNVVYAFTNSLEKQLFQQAFHKAVESFRSGANSPLPEAKLIRAALQRLLLDGILFYEKLIRTYESEFEINLSEILTWPDGFPTDQQLTEQLIKSPHGAQKMTTSLKKTALKSLARHLTAIGDLHRYKTLIDGSENYSTSQNYYLKSAQVWPTNGHPYNQLGVVTYFSMLYRSARRARRIPIDVLSRQRQSRVIDEIYFLVRALACAHPYAAAKDRLAQRLSAARAKIAKYEPLLDAECGKCRDEAKALKKANRSREIWIHPVTAVMRDDSGDLIIDDVFATFLEQPPTKLHRRAVSYLMDTVGMLISKIGMDHFESVSERGFALFLASLSKSTTDFSAKQVLQIAALLLYAAHNAASNTSHHLEMAVNTLLTFYTFLISILMNDIDSITSALKPEASEGDKLPARSLMILPALNLISKWIKSHEGWEIIESVENKSTLPSTIVKDVSIQELLEKSIDNLKTLIGEPTPTNQCSPEEVFVASFFTVFDGSPTTIEVSSIDDRNETIRLNRYRLLNLVKAAQKLKPSIKDRIQNEDEKIQKEVKNRDLTREEIVEIERRQNIVVMMVKPEHLVIDTNVFIDHLELLKKILELKTFEIIIPTTVLTELVGLSSSSSSGGGGGDVGGGEHEEYVTNQAKIALKWLKEQATVKSATLKVLTTHGTKIGFAMVTEDNAETQRKDQKVNDDMILQSVTNLIETQSIIPPPAMSGGGLYENALYRTTVLLTEDRGMTIKAAFKNIPCRHIRTFINYAKN